LLFFWGLINEIHKSYPTKMTSSQKLTWGVILAIFGYFFMVIGFGISFTLIGACLGIPMVVIGLPFAIWGSIWTWQGRVLRAEEAIAAGVKQGIQQAQTQANTLQNTPPPMPTDPPKGEGN
jgi:hypothetical protein